MNYLLLILWVYLKGLGVAGWVHPVVSSVPKYILLRKQVVRPWVRTIEIEFACLYDFYICSCVPRCWLPYLSFQKA